MGQMTTQKDEKWRGSVTSIVPGPLDKVWEILADFDGLQRNYPQLIVSCETLEGEKNKLGSLRKIVVPFPDGSTFVCKERLVALDHEKHTLKYTIEDDVTYTGYFSNIAAESAENVEQTRVQWDFEVNPITMNGASLTGEDYVLQQKGFVQIILTMLGQKINQTGPQANSEASQVKSKQDEQKWRGSVTSIVAGPLDKVWEILADFDGLQRNYPQLIFSCETVEGEKNKLGSLRKVVVPFPDGSTFVCKERIVALDHEKHTLKYTIEDDVTYTGYFSNIAAESAENVEQTRVQWDFEVNPITANSAILTEENYVLQQKGCVQIILTMLSQKLSQ